jgi:hypothetical protein
MDSTGGRVHLRFFGTPYKVSMIVAATEIHCSKDADMAALVPEHSGFPFPCGLRNTTSADSSQSRNVSSKLSLTLAVKKSDPSYLTISSQARRSGKIIPPDFSSRSVSWQTTRRRASRLAAQRGWPGEERQQRETRTEEQQPYGRRHRF